MTDRTVLITGAGSGVGLSTAVAFAREGVNVVAVDIDGESADRAAAAVVEEGGKAIGVRADVSSDLDMAAAVRAAVTAFGGLTYAVNNAAITQRASPVGELTEADWDRVVAVNAKGVFLSMRNEIPALLEHPGTAAIVNVSSAGGVVGLFGMGVYAAAKHAVVGLTKSAALDYARAGLRVNVVCPGSIDTPMVQSFIAESDDDGVMELYRNAHPMGRIARPSEVADAAVWLCSNRSSFVTGQALSVDGGYTTQ